MVAKPVAEGCGPGQMLQNAISGSAAGLKEASYSHCATSSWKSALKSIGDDFESFPVYREKFSESKVMRSGALRPLQELGAKK